MLEKEGHPLAPRTFSIEGLRSKFAMTVLYDPQVAIIDSYSTNASRLKHLAGCQLVFIDCSCTVTLPHNPHS